MQMGRGGFSGWMIFSALWTILFQILSPFAPIPEENHVGIAQCRAIIGNSLIGHLIGIGGTWLGMG